MSRRYHLTLAEQETVILWDNELRLERRGPQRAVTYTVPKKSIGIRPPYGESRRQRDIENARKNGLPFMKPLQEEQDVER